MIRLTLGLAILAVVSGLLAVGRLGPEIVDNIAVFVFMGSAFGLLLMLVVWWTSHNLR